MEYNLASVMPGAESVDYGSYGGINAAGCIFRKNI
mgnify:FL=1